MLNTRPTLVNPSTARSPIAVWETPNHSLEKFFSAIEHIEENHLPFSLGKTSAAANTPLCRSTPANQVFRLLS
ncbi:hypothetical protein KR51_00015960 [Rubidibacter lacunae KORDI 51-2]|uniref:Uncharacterized protein n=1 Tax=Rubidibacter lacunae KORDI 51-2 TaxID=582515 RepID=U5DB26_9CHRO|nr:hypothetical protein KR51_00015960 [Rubidibacter lacunae KORDI 51-2]